jgi:hypothetical protein
VALIALFLGACCWVWLSTKNPPANASTSATRTIPADLLRALTLRSPPGGNPA